MTRIVCIRRPRIGEKTQCKITVDTTLEELRKSPNPSQGFCYYDDPWSDIRIFFLKAKKVFGVANFLGGKDHSFGPKHLFLVSTQYGDDIKNHLEHVWPHISTNTKSCTGMEPNKTVGGYILNTKTRKKMPDPVATGLIENSDDIDCSQIPFLKKLLLNSYVNSDMYETLCLILSTDRVLLKERSLGEKGHPQQGKSSVVPQKDKVIFKWMACNGRSR